MGILLFLLKYMYISLLLKMIYGFSWPAKIMVSPFKLYGVRRVHIPEISFCNFVPDIALSIAFVL